MSVHFFGFPARRDEAQPSRCNEKQRSWGVEKVCNQVRSGLTEMVTVQIVTFLNKLKKLSKLTSGQLPFLG